MLLVCVAVILGTAVLRWVSGPGARVAQLEDGAAVGSIAEID